MKKITLLMALFAMFSLSAQTVLTEDFDSGLTIPAGWTNNDIDGSGNVWIISTGGDAVGFESPNTIYYENGGMTDNYALFDSDGYGGGPEEAALESPVFDCSALTSVTLKYNHFFTSGYGGSASVEVYDGSAWVEVASYAAATVFGLQNIDVTTHLAGVSNAQVRFKWSGDWAWGWAFDTVEVYSCTETAAPACATVIAPTDAATDVATTASVDGLSRVVAFTWDAVPGALSYDFVFEGSTLTNVSTPTINITGLDYGTTYSWSIAPVNCFGVATGCATWTFTTEDAPAGPANDECVDAETISCGDAVSGTTLSATDSGNNTSNDVWYVLAGTANGEEITASLCGSGYDTFIRIFDACGGTQVASNDDAETADYCGGVFTTQSVVTWTSDGATTYYIMVEGFGANNGDFDLAITCVPAPACVAPTFTLTNGANNCPTLEFYVDVNVTNLGTGAAVNISDDSGVIETAVGLGTYSVGPYAAATLVNITVEDAAGDTCNSLSAFTTPTVCPPSNDDCSGATALTVDADLSCSNPVAGSTLGSTQSLPGCLGTANDDVWYSFVATGVTNVITIANTSGNSDIVTEVFDSCGGTSIKCQDTPNSPVTVTGLTSGNTYYFRIYTYSSSVTITTSFTVCVGTPPAPPANETCAGATEIFCGDTLNVSSVSSTGTSEGIGCSMGSNGIWFTFIGTGGDMTVESVASFDHEQAIASGACGSLVNVSCTDGNGTGVETYTFTSVANETYYVYISNWLASSTATGTIDISLSCDTIGIQDYNASELFTYYPNPVNNTLSLKGQKAIQDVAVYNMLGQEVLRSTPNTVTSDLDVSTLNAGTYFVKVTVDNSTKTIKIIKK